ncbi:unannotated protein [freshwater metagenome]|uniref:Unannotated protein n=1 Tax=freshwater metagenome TaxID=449393 RepID=A0A6J6DJ16_9ZZZZ
MAAKLWGADYARFSTGGSTHANQAIILALGKPGQKIALTRTAHRSVLSALVLTGLEPIWLTPEIDAKSGVPMGIPVKELERVLDQKPIALLLTEPSYLGTLSEVKSLIVKAHTHAIPVIVDAAWGAHFGFNSNLPQHALQLGADALITSVHKTLPGYSASALLLAQGTLLNLDRIEQSFETTHTTSPAGAPLASIDGCRALLQNRGDQLTANLVDLVNAFKDKVDKACGMSVFLNASDFPKDRFDPAKVVLRANLLGVSGVDVENELEKHNIRVEMADQDTIVFLATLADRSEDFDEVAAKLIPILEKLRSQPRQTQTALSWSIVPTVGMSIRDAYFADTEFVNAANAIGRVSADLIAPYPPGVAVVAPGEVLTAQIVDGLATSKTAGVRIAYASDPTLKTYRVTKSL